MYIFRNGYFFEDALCDGRVDEIDQRLLLQYHLPGRLLRPRARLQQDFDFGQGRVQVASAGHPADFVVVELDQAAQREDRNDIDKRLTSLVSKIVRRISITCFNTF